MTFYIGGNKVASINVSNAGGGVILSPGAPTTYFSGNKISLNGDTIASHGVAPHAAATTIAGLNSTFYINNKLVIVNNDNTTCTHLVVA